MIKCIKCGDECSDKRAELGYSVCLKCGDQVAKVQTAFKAKQTAQHYNNGFNGIK